MTNNNDDHDQRDRPRLKRLPVPTRVDMPGFVEIFDTRGRMLATIIIEDDAIEIIGRSVMVGTVEPFADGQLFRVTFVDPRPRP